MNRREVVWLGGGAALAWPLSVHGQQPNKPVVGFLSSRSPEESKHLVAAFRSGLAASGYSDGQNAAIAYRWAEGAYARLPTLARELVSIGIAVLVSTEGDPSVLAARAATADVPIVFIAGSDPVRAGLVASMNRPGGNITGISLMTTAVESKKLGLLKELVPSAALVGVLLNLGNPEAQAKAEELRDAARAIRLEVLFEQASSEDELEAAFAALINKKVGAVLISSDPFFDSVRLRIVALAARARLPAIHHFRDSAVAGGLMSYGIDLLDGYRLAGRYAGQILAGAKPADLPVVQATKFEFVVNLKAAKAIGIELPSSFLARADEVIE